MNTRKLLLNEKVEVRQIEEGLQGSWYSAVVVGVSDMSREVKYDELLCETEDSMLVESIPVTGEIEGVYQRSCVKSNHRGRIRPLPPHSKTSSVKAGLSFGFCVDVLFKDAWWEGVIFDSNEGSDERSIFFPDEGDECSFNVSDLRATHEWDEYSGNWRERGNWTLVKLAEECKTSVHLAKFAKFVWSRLRVNYGFIKMISEWTSGAYSLWKKYFMEVVSVIATKSIRRGLVYSMTSHFGAVGQRGNKYKRHQWSDKDGSMSIEISLRRNEKNVSQSVKSKQYYTNESKQLENSVICGANSSSHQTDALSGKSELTHGRRATRHQCGGISNVRSVHMSERVEDLATTSGQPVRNEKRQSQSQIALSRRKMRLVESNLAPVKLKPFNNQEHLIRFRSSSPWKHTNFATGVCSDGHVNKAKHLTRRQMEKNFAARFRKCNHKIVSFSFRKQRSCLKVKKRFPKKIQRSNAKAKLSCTKEGSVSELAWKEEINLDKESAFQQEFETKNVMPEAEKLRSKKSRRNDSVCFVCQYGDDLLPCDNCTSSYHIVCIGLKEVPDGNWFCPSCRCGLCGLRSSSEDDLFTEVCYQCGRQYHLDCLNSQDISIFEDPLPDKFCSKRCFKICAWLHDHMQTLYPTPMEGLLWTIARSRRNDYNIRDERVHPRVQLSQVMKVLHECFEPTIEPHTKKDLVTEVVYNSGSKFKRLDFHGFYVMVLLNGEELACVATLRIHGHKVAEMPLIATPFRYRRKGMCQLLVQEMEKMLIELGIERLVLPAISQLRETWVNVFGFEEMSASLRQELSGYPFLVFSGTTMFHKVLCESNLTNYTSHAQQEKKITLAGISQEQEDNNGSKFGLSYNGRQRSEMVSKDQMAKQKLYYMRRRRHETCGQEKMMTQGLYYTRRRRLEDETATQGSNRNTSPVKYVYKRRRVLATKEAAH